MQYTQLGRSGLKVSRLCLGTVNFGPQTGEPAAHSMMNAALDSGISFFDTANVYGGSGRRAPGVPLDADALKRLDEIFPGHRSAPEDYTW
ncbi:hypothetical protein NKCBBBOE_00226 [Pseudarthrobacter sp. MM222]|nr:aldo/keto reductase [Pseudarthrobacter sp. MM222]CAI3791181.1 hypothetical protein NKCBBBOE_00226 [Pseudarthrobacter sp. MM222]